MDPFLQKKYNVGHNYMADVHRTYNRNIPMPTFDRVIKNREREVEQMRAVLEENERLRENEARRVAFREKRRARWGLFEAQLSKILQDVTTTDRRDDRTERRGVPPTEEPNDGPARGEPQDLQPEVLRADVPDPRGPSAEHTDEGRPTREDGVTEQPAIVSVQDE